MKKRPVTIGQILEIYPEALCGFTGSTIAYVEGRNISEEVDVCYRCWRSIRDKKMPELAVGNGLLVVHPPQEIFALNWIELMCIQLARPVQVISLLLSCCWRDFNDEIF